jgi:hypothetical protein
MRKIEIIAQWIFASFMAVVSFLCSLFLLTFLFLELLGLPIGTKPPPDFHSSLSPTVFWVIATSMLLIPLFVASYVGAITAPNSQLRLASVVFPFSTFLFINIVPSLGRGNQSFSIEYFLETGASCTIAGVCLYFRWKRQLSKRTATKNVSLAAGPRIEP